MSGAWSIIAPARGKRPHDHADSPEPRGAGSARCPFCPGHEPLLPGVIDEIPQDEPPGWRVRSTPNLYPAVSLEDFAAIPHSTGHRTMDGYGLHEVIVDSPNHDDDIADFDDAQMDAVVTMYHRRYMALAALPKIEAIVLCRNHGHQAGASLHHPHAQIVGLSAIPQRIRRAGNWARAAYRETGHCVACIELDAELRDGARIIEKTDRFVVLVPFAATAPFETWIVPRRHQASFDAVRPDELMEFGRLLRRSVQWLREVAGEFVPYNFAVDSAPTDAAGAGHLHWKLRLVKSF